MRKVTIEKGDLKFTCEGIHKNIDGTLYIDGVNCRRCKNEMKCKIYVGDYNNKITSNPIQIEGLWDLEVKSLSNIFNASKEVYPEEFDEFRLSMKKTEEVESPEQTEEDRVRREYMIGKSTGRFNRRIRGRKKRFYRRHGLTKEEVEREEELGRRYEKMEQVNVNTRDYTSQKDIDRILKKEKEGHVPTLRFKDLKESLIY